MPDLVIVLVLMSSVGLQKWPMKQRLLPRVLSKLMQPRVPMLVEVANAVSDISMEQSAKVL
jgi:hypothetical protein